MHRTVLIAALVIGQIDSVRGDIPTEYGAPESGKVRIVRDKFGVPHVIAMKNREMFFGVGFAQAEDQLENLAQNYLLSEGRGAEFLGQQHMPVDHLTRSLGLLESAKEGYRRLAPDEREMLTAFANGWWVELWNDC